MILREHEPLAPHTTLGVGGPAALFAEVDSQAELHAALAYARERGLRVRMLGAGSNVLVPDAGVDAFVVKLTLRDVSFAGEDDARVTVTAGAGMPWDEFVTQCTDRGLWGVENLAAIPGTVGGAVVQNIGAYGAELAETFLYADALDMHTLRPLRVETRDVAFGYRTSVFKARRELVVVRAAFGLSTRGAARTAYTDLSRAAAAGVPLATPAQVAAAVRTIRAAKFPSMRGEGTAGSFFANPSVSRAEAAALLQRFPELPTRALTDGTTRIAAAWIIDHVLNYKGRADGFVRAYEKQALVLVAKQGATARAIDAFAHDLEQKFFAATGIMLEREVETFA